MSGIRSLDSEKTETGRGRGRGKQAETFDSRTAIPIFPETLLLGVRRWGTLNYCFPLATRSHTDRACLPGQILLTHGDSHTDSP